MFEVSEFRDTEFMTAQEKALVLKTWERFISKGFRWDDFSERLYQHLIMHCSFIAHYDKAGFHTTYFQKPEDTERFLNQFNRKEGAISVEYGWSLWLTGYDYSDINNAMCAVVEKYLPVHKPKLRNQARERDILTARVLLAKHGIELKEVV